MRDVFAMARELPPELAPNTTLRIDGETFLVDHPDGRSQKIRVRREGDRYVFTSRVIGARRVEGLSWEELAQLVWHRNRVTPLVAFMLDGRGRLVGRIEQPVATLDPEELHAYLLLLARECDRLEFVLTGRDEM